MSADGISRRLQKPKLSEAGDVIETGIFQYLRKFVELVQEKLKQEAIRYIQKLPEKESANDCLG